MVDCYMYLIYIITYPALSVYNYLVPDSDKSINSPSPPTFGTRAYDKWSKKNIKKTF